MTPIPNTLFSPIHERASSDIPAAAAPAASSFRASVQYTQQQQPTPPTSASTGRFVAGISPTPMAPSSNRGSAPHLQTPGFSNNGSSAEASNVNLASNRISLYGSPLLVANIPLPPGAHNPLMPSPVVHNSGTSPGASLTGYQPHTQYQPGGVYPTPGTSTIPLAVSTVANPSLLQQQPISAHNLGSNHSSSNNMTSGVFGAKNMSRPMSQQGFASTSSPVVGVGIGSASLNGAAVGSGPSSSSSNNNNSASITTQNLLNELAMYTNGSSSGDRSSRIGQTRSTPNPPPLLQQHSQPQLQLNQHARSVHPRQMQGQEARSLSSEELKVGPAGASSDSRQGGGAVKNIMKGMNAKWSEIKKASLN